MIAAALLIASPAHGQDREERAKQLFFEAHAAADAGDHRTACAKFEESLQLFRRASTLLNLGECSEHLGKLATALRYWRQGAALVESSDERMILTKEHISVLEQRVPRLQLVLPAPLPEASVVSVDGVAVPEEALGARVELPVDPGEHVVTLRSPGRAGSMARVTLAVAERRSVTLQLGEPERTFIPDRAQPAGTDSRLIAGIVVGGLGVVGLVVGAVTGGLVLDRKATVEEFCSDDVCTDPKGVEAADEGRTLAVVSTVGFAVGGAALVTGIVLVVVGARADSDEERATLRPLASPQGGGLLLRGTF